MQAGELAPPILYDDVVLSPDGSNWDHKNFTGKITVVSFFPNLSNTTAAFVSMWNELVDQFQDQHIQFLLVARDSQADLARWQQQNPPKGWLLRDAKWQTARSWGTEFPQSVIIGKDARILCFCHHPDEFLLKTVAAGKTPKHPRLKPFLFGGDKPDLPPSYTVHISHSKRDAEEGTSAVSGDDHWSRLGFQLKPVLAEIYSIEESHIDLPANLDNSERYDLELLLPQEEPYESVLKLVQQAIESYFKFKPVRQQRERDVYILTLPHGLGPSMQLSESFGGGFMGASARSDKSGRVGPITSVSGSGIPMTTLCEILDRHLRLLSVDETGLQGDYNFSVKNEGDTEEDFLQALREQTGILATRGRRKITILEFHPLNGEAPAVPNQS